MGKVDRLLALVGDGHRRQRGVDLLHFQRRNQAVELHLVPHALDLHLRAQGIADVVVETDDLAFVVLGSERWISRLDANAQSLFGGEQAAAGQQAQRQTADQGELLHDGSLSLVIGGVLQDRRKRGGVDVPGIILYL
ncbi:hypothetical protein D3C84_811130 [compost metagenome]